ncbi:MAG: SDR family oxidoreductase [Candidatus Omnitrophica bacterium]|nr:SDR family oxidoreductase [Candidatus Omnitrophota bacterium]
MQILSEMRHNSYTLEEIEVDLKAQFDLLVEEQDVQSFAHLSGDFSDLHLDSEFARRSRFRGRVVHGMLPFTALSAMVGMVLPGKNAILLGVEASFLAPARIGDRIRVSGRVVSKSIGTRIIKLHVLLTNLSTQQPITEGKIEVYVSPPAKKGVTMSELQDLDLNLDFTDRTVLITGASRGIGETTAKLFASRGANVVVNYRNGKSDAEAIVREITAHKRRAIAVGADVSVPSEVEAMVEKTLAEFKRIDVLVNNAVRDASPLRFEELTWEALQEELNVTVKGAFLCCQGVIPSMLRQGGGNIVNVSTVFVESPVPHQVRYITSKSGLVGLSRALAAEYAGRNIRVNLVTPNITPTDLTNTLSDQAFQRIADSTPMKRNCQPLDVAKAILILASPYTAYTTGQQFMVTGGSPPLF